MTIVQPIQIQPGRSKSLRIMDKIGVNGRAEKLLNTRWYPFLMKKRKCRLAASIMPQKRKLKTRVMPGPTGNANELSISRACPFLLYVFRRKATKQSRFSRKTSGITALNRWQPGDYCWSNGPKNHRPWFRPSYQMRYQNIAGPHKTLDLKPIHLAVIAKRFATLCKRNLLSQRLAAERRSHLSIWSKKSTARNLRSSPKRILMGALLPNALVEQHHSIAGNANLCFELA